MREALSERVADPVHPVVDCLEPFARIILLIVLPPAPPPPCPTNSRSLLYSAAVSISPVFFPQTGDEFRSVTPGLRSHARVNA